jgi:hypothetical protein
MLQMPPPLMQVFFSASRAQENAEVMGVTSGLALTKSSSADPGDNGTQVALVNKSTDLSKKNFGKVPPKLDTLGPSAKALKISGKENSRCEKGHVGATNLRICDSGVECRGCDKHNGAGECRIDV